MLVRIPGSLSVCVFASRRRRSLLRIRSVSFGAMRRIDLTVASRITGTTSPNPVNFGPKKVNFGSRIDNEWTNEMRPDFLHDLLVRELVGKLVETLQQRHPHRSIGRSEHSNERLNNDNRVFRRRKARRQTQNER